MMTFPFPGELSLEYTSMMPKVFSRVRTSGEKNSLKFQRASVLQSSWQLAELTPVQEHGHPDGLPITFNLIMH